MADGIEMHWVMTVQSGLPSGAIATYNQDGTFRSDPGGTREQAFDVVFRLVAEGFRRHHGTTADPVVIFWSLEPNALPTEADRA